LLICRTKSVVYSDQGTQWVQIYLIQIEDFAGIEPGLSMPR